MHPLGQQPPLQERSVHDLSLDPESLLLAAIRIVCLLCAPYEQHLAIGTPEWLREWLCLSASLGGQERYLFGAGSHQPQQQPPVAMAPRTVQSTLALLLLCAASLTTVPAALASSAAVATSAAEPALEAPRPTVGARALLQVRTLLIAKKVCYVRFRCTVVFCVVTAPGAREPVAAVALLLDHRYP